MRLSRRSLGLVTGLLVAVLALAYFLLPRFLFVDRPLRAGNAAIVGVPSRVGEASSFGVYLCAAHGTPRLRSVEWRTRGSVDVVRAVVHADLDGANEKGTFALGTMAGTPPDFDEPYADGGPLGAFTGQVTEIDDTTVTLGCDTEGYAFMQIAVAGVPRDGSGGAITGARIRYDAWGRSWTDDVDLALRWRPVR